MHAWSFTFTPHKQRLLLSCHSSVVARVSPHCDPVTRSAIIKTAGGQWIVDKFLGFCCFQTSLFGTLTTTAPTGLFGTQNTGFGQTQTGTGLFGQTAGFGQTQQQVCVQCCFGMSLKTSFGQCVAWV